MNGAYPQHVDKNKSGVIAAQFNWIGFFCLRADKSQVA
jgi:hypothetical protein